ncbi:MAG: type VII toxin-antitoxin system HepT family RNase toxin [Thermodesulfovibrionales bacterium]
MNVVLFQKLERLKEEVLYLKTNKTRLLKSLGTSVEIKKATERSVYLCSEIVLDIADMVIVLNSFPKPSTYSDSIYKLGEHRIIPKDFARKFVYIAGLRNFLAHDYQIDTLPHLKRFLKSGISDIERFINYIERL